MLEAHSEAVATKDSVEVSEEIFNQYTSVLQIDASLDVEMLLE